MMMILNLFDRCLTERPLSICHFLKPLEIYHVSWMLLFDDCLIGTACGEGFGSMAATEQTSEGGAILHGGTQ